MKEQTIKAYDKMIKCVSCGFIIPDEQMPVLSPKGFYHEKCFKPGSM